MWVRGVRSDAASDGRSEIGLACRECVEYFGRVNPEFFPTIEEYQAIVERYPEPMFASKTAAEASESMGDPFWPAYKKS